MTNYVRSSRIDYFSGWHYLFSTTFREQIHQKWGNSLMLQSLFFIGSLTGILLTSAAAVLLIQLIWYLSS